MLYLQMIEIHIYPPCSQMNSYTPKYFFYFVKQQKYTQSLNSCVSGQLTREVGKYWGYMMTIGALAHSEKEKEVNQFVQVLRFSFNGIASISLLPGIGVFLPVA